MANAPKAGTQTRRPAVSPEDWLARAMEARTPLARAKAATRGLAARGLVDRTTQAMLLRQMYLAHFEARRFEEALRFAEEAAALGVDVSDVLLQDAARAAVAAGDVDRAVLHLRAAARRGPPERRAFHSWTLGSVLFLAQRYREAIGALERAARWGTSDKPLYRAQLALVRIAAGERVLGLQAIVDALGEAPCGRGYGRFVLGHLAYASGDRIATRRYLEAFVRRATEGRPAAAIALEGEVSMARATLAKLSDN